MHVLICGAGIFGVSAAYELARRGARVTVVDPGPLPHPLAASTDISKVVRLEYGTDSTYAAWMERALAGFRAWNREDGGAPLFHETGVLFLAAGALAAGGFEADSLATLAARGHAARRITKDEVAARFPAWAAAPLGEGVIDPEGGWVESGRLTLRRTEVARAAGAALVSATAVRLLHEGSRVVGVSVLNGADIRADHVVVAAGAWTTDLVPELSGALRAVAQPVFHLRPRVPEDFVAERFPVFGADIANTGWYGFPLHPREGVVKIAHHGTGRELHPASPERVVTEDDHARLRDFLATMLPALADAPVVHTRACMYSDSPDQHLWIARDPARGGLTVAAGDSGHAFKFAPLLGGWIADAVTDAAPVPERFRWRVATAAPDRARGDAARSHT